MGWSVRLRQANCKMKIAEMSNGNWYALEHMQTGICTSSNDHIFLTVFWQEDGVGGIN